VLYKQIGRVRSIGNFVAKKVSDRLRSLKNDDPKAYAEAWDSLAPFVKIGAMEDEKFADQISELILFGTTSKPSEQDGDDPIEANGKSFTTLEGYRSRLSEENSKRILYSTDDVSQAGALNLWTAQGAEVLKLETVIDTQFIPWLEYRHEELKFQRVDAELDESLKEEDPELADQDGTTDSERLRSLIKDALNNEKVTVQVQALKAEGAPPAMILLPEQMRRLNDMGALMEQRLPGLPDHHVLLVNRRHPLVEGLLKLQSGSVLVGDSGGSPTLSLSQNLARHLYDMARLGVGGLEPNELAGFQTRSAELMGTLMQRGL
jgi:molecular chaperone HtpG